MGNQRSGGNNTKKGKKGWQAKITPTQYRALLFNLIQNDWSTITGKKFLETEFDLKVSAKGFYNWKKELRNSYDARETNPDKPVEWGNWKSLNDLSNLPFENAHMRLRLFRLWEHIQIRHLANDPPVTNLPPPTYRRVKWWAYAFEYYAQTLHHGADILHVADLYTTEEILADWSHTDFYRDHIDKWLLMKPWISKEYMQEYISLIKNGTIPPLDTANIKAIEPADVKINPHLSDPYKTPAVIKTPELIAAGFLLDQGRNYGGVVDKLFDYKGAWRFLPPSIRQTKETIQSWVWGESIWTNTYTEDSTSEATDKN